MVKIKRIYEAREPNDGYRILVDRLWPRGVLKKEAHVDLWMKEVTPSTELRKWFNHEPEKWAAFSKAYIAELKQTGAVKELITIIRKQKKVTLLYAAKDEEHTHALVLLAYIKPLLT
ncbi:MAG: DUF488 domain-containing protein [Bacteroidota bacterium]